MRSLSGETTVDDGEQSLHSFAAVPSGQANSAGLLRQDSVDGRGSGLPSIPSICQLNSSELLPLGAGGNVNINASTAPRPGSKDSDHRYHMQSRLGMSMQSTHDRFDRMLDPETNALKEWHRRVEQAREQDSQVASTIASTVPYSTDLESERPRNSPSRAFMDHVLQSRRAATLTDAQPVDTKLGDATQSAAEIAAPSVSTTQDLRTYDQYIQETGSMINNLVQDIASLEDAGATAGQEDDQAFTHTQPNTSQLSPRPSDNATHDGRTDSAGSIQRSVPMALRKLAPHLLALQRHLSAQPNVSTTLQNISDRLWMLENASFQHVPAEEINDKFELMDGRLLEIEHRLIDLEKNYFKAEEARETALVRREDFEDGSICSGGSDLPMSLLTKVLNETQKNARLDAIEERLNHLESAEPSHANPWVIEVILLPWGRDLKGIWFSQAELDRTDCSMSGASQASEDRSQTFLRHPSRSLQLPDAQHPDLSGDELYGQEGLEQEEHWHPRACGPKSKVWHRLKSRGLIRHVTIKEPGARHILNEIHDTFTSDLLDSLGGNSAFIDDSQETDSESESQSTENSLEPAETASASAAFHGYLTHRPPVVPLRKVYKESQLRWLPKSELITPTLWNAEFLSSGVLMNATGGKKRLYVTVGAAYRQSIRHEMTWKEVKELPRVRRSSSSSGDDQEPEDNEHEHEPWWDSDPRLDPLYDRVSSDRDLSNSSFSSSNSNNSLAYRPAELEFSRSQAASSASRQKGHLTPKSESPQPRPPRRISRTHSAPSTYQTASGSQTPSKRRAAASLDDFHDYPPPYSAPNARYVSCRITKRRRMGRSPTEDRTSIGSGANTIAGAAEPGSYGYTPRRSREPSLPVSAFEEFGSDGVASASLMANANRVASIPKGNGLNTQSAYATPFSGTVGMAGPCPPDFSETELDSSGAELEEGEDYGDEFGGDTEADDDDTDLDMADAHKQGVKPARAHEDDMRDADASSWQGFLTDGEGPPEGDESQVDFVKREDDNDMDGNIWINCVT